MLSEPKTTLLEAMARMEGFYVPGSRPNRNNNPGDIEFGEFAKENGAIGTDGRFAIFPDVTTGFNAMRALLIKHYTGLTIEQAINKYAPPTENNTQEYINNICNWSQNKPTDIFDQVLS